MVYEYLLQYTNDPYVQETLRFLMTREVAHYQMFEAALETIQPNFPPGVLQADPRFSNLYFNMSDGQEIRGPWNNGESSQLGEQWQYVKDPVGTVRDTDSLTDVQPKGTVRTMQGTEEINAARSKEMSEEIKAAAPIGPQQWNDQE